MAKAIDADILLQNFDDMEPYEEYESEHDLWLDMRMEVIHAPTLTPPNEPLSVLVNDEPDREYIDYICPRCKSIISQRRRGQRMETVYKCKFHDNCGQRVDWSNPQPYRRPPERQEDDHA